MGENEPRLTLGDTDEERITVDADEACFSFHVKRFAELANDPVDGDGSWVPLHDITCTLMERLLGCGLIDMPKEELTRVVERFAESKSGDGSGKEYERLIERLRPPRVLFNRELRAMLLCEVEPSIRAVL